MQSGTRWFVLLTLTAACFWPLGSLGAQENASRKTFADHGVAAAVSRARGVAAIENSNGDPAILVWLADYRGTRNLLMIDARTGDTRHFPIEIAQADSPFASLMSSRGRFYSLWAYQFVEFDPLREQYTFTARADDRVAMAFTEGPDGTVWAATYPDSHVFAFDPETRKLTQYGSVNQETWPQYNRSIAVGDEGWLYVAVGNVESHIVALHPETRDIRPVLAPDQRRQGTAYVFRGTDGNAYGRPYSDGPWFRLSGGKRHPVTADGTPVERVDLPPEAPILEGTQEDVFATFPDGSRIERIDLPESRIQIRAADSDEVRELTFEYESEGSHIMSMVLGPGQKIYGSTGHPLRFYIFDPKTGSFDHHGLKGFNGHLNAMAIQNGKVYGGLYAGGTIYEYDPARPWNDSADENPNPRPLNSRLNAIGRPHELLAHPDGRTLVLAGTPGYGLTGGGLFIYDTRSGESTLLEHEKLIPQQSTVALEALPDGNLVGGTTIRPGTGGKTIASEGELYLFDLAEKKVTWHAPIVPGASEIRDLKALDDGRVIGIAEGPVLFAFDAAQRKVLHREKLEDYGNPAGGQAPRILRTGPDDSIYALFTGAIVRIDPATYEHQKLAAPPASAGVGIVIHNGRLYFSHESHLWSYALPTAE